LQCWPLPADVAGTSAETAAAGAGEEAGPPPPQPERHYLLCCVRLSPEKEPARFVDLAAELSRRGALRALRVTPVVAGAGWDSPHGAQLACRLEREVPEAEVLRDFMGGAELAELYSHTALNFHPPLYDAYGMTVVEAASQGGRQPLPRRRGGPPDAGILWGLCHCWGRRSSGGGMLWACQLPACWAAGPSETASSRRAPCGPAARPFRGAHRPGRAAAMPQARPAWCTAAATWAAPTCCVRKPGR
jgi:hypothetical protein